jgi:hypothetical protein
MSFLLRQKIRVEKNKREDKRILALITSGIFVVIILPIIGVLV